MGISVCADVPGVGTVRLIRETGLHPVERRVERAVLYPEARERAGDDLGNWRLRSLLGRDLCGSAGEKC